MTIRSYILLLALGGCLATGHRNIPKNLLFPFDFPLTLSGNFGELRANHFHGGVDFKTQGGDWQAYSLHCRRLCKPCVGYARRLWAGFVYHSS